MFKDSIFDSSRVDALARRYTEEVGPILRDAANLVGSAFRNHVSNLTAEDVVHFLQDPLSALSIDRVPSETPRREEVLFKIPPVVHMINGATVDLRRPDLSDIGLVEILHNLGHMCRFNGATNPFYDVERHSYLVCVAVSYITDDPMDQLWALLHDGSEAFSPDVIAPIKNNFDTGELTDIEKRLLRSIADRFGLSWGDGKRPYPDVVYHVDKLVSIDEINTYQNRSSYLEGGMRCLLKAHGRSTDRYDEVLMNLSGEPIRDRFIQKFHNLTARVAARTLQQGEEVYG